MILMNSCEDKFLINFLASTLQAYKAAVVTLKNQQWIQLTATVVRIMEISYIVGICMFRAGSIPYTSFFEGCNGSWEQCASNEQK